MSQIVAPRYARAVFEEARTLNKAEAVLRDLENIEKVMLTLPEAASFFKNPAITSTERIGVLEKVFKPVCDNLTFRFLLFLEQKNRLAIIADVISSYKKVFASMMGILAVLIETGHEIEGAQLEKIVKKLETKYMKKVDVRIIINSKLLGGIKVTIEGRVEDYSLASQLNRFHDRALEQTLN